MASERWLRGMIVTAAVASPAAAAVLYWVEPTDGSWYPRCWLHWLTGLHCPFCGTKLEDNFGLSTQTPHAAENLKTP